MKPVGLQNNNPMQNHILDKNLISMNLTIVSKWKKFKQIFATWMLVRVDEIWISILNPKIYERQRSQIFVLENERALK